MKAVYAILMCAALLCSTALAGTAQTPALDEQRPNAKDQLGVSLSTTSQNSHDIELENLYAEAEYRKYAGEDADEIWNRISAILEGVGDTPRTDNSLDEGGETCETAVLIPSLPYCDIGSTSNNIADYDPPAGFDCSASMPSFGGKDVVYRYTPTQTEIISVSLCGTTFDSYLHIYANACPGNPDAVQVCCDDDACEVPYSLASCCPQVALVAGVTYYIIVDGWREGDSGSYELTITYEPGCGRCPPPPPGPCVCNGSFYGSGALGYEIPDNGLIQPCLADGGVSHTITVPPTTNTVADVNVDVNITHSWTGDVAIVVEHGGVQVVLKSRDVGLGSACDNIYTTFDDEGWLWVFALCPHSGCFQTYDLHGCGNTTLSAFDGMPVSGPWTIYVADDVTNDIGTLDSWGLCITEETSCEQPPIIVNVSNGLPYCECLEYLCPGQEHTICVVPLHGIQMPSEFSFRAGCMPTDLEIPFGCLEECPPTLPQVVGEWTYNPNLGGWCIGIVASTPGCFCFCLDAVLPVELSSFEAIAGDGEVTLNWSTASETDNDYFDILRDGSSVAQIIAGNSPVGQTYKWTDDDLLNGREYTYDLVAVSLGGLRETLASATATPIITAAAVTEYALLQNYPNPFNPTTEIVFDLPESGSVTLTVTNALGQTVATLVNGSLPVGRHTVTFNGSGLSSGLYFYHLTAGDFSAIRKMVLMK